MTQERFFELADKYFADDLDDAECIELLINDTPTDKFKEYCDLYKQIRLQR